MFYDIRMKYASKAEREKIRDLEKELEKRTEKAKETVENDFSDYVLSFGLTGPMARGEGTVFFGKGKSIIGSDIDFAIVTKKLSFRKQKELGAEIKKIFAGSPPVSSLFFAPSIFKRPDLMFCEYANAGKVLFGQKLKCRKEIPAWEAAKLLVSRSGSLLNSVSFRKGLAFHDDFFYGWSKSILGAAEAMLVLENRYSFLMKERSKNVKSSLLAGQLHGFKELYQQAYEARYSGRLAESREKLFSDAAAALSFAFENVSAALERRSGKKVGRLGAPFSSAICTRLSYFCAELKEGKVSIPLSEPFVSLFLRMKETFASLADGITPAEKHRKRLVRLWRNSGEFRFWLPY